MWQVPTALPFADVLQPLSHAGVKQILPSSTVVHKLHFASFSETSTSLRLTRHHSIA